jgi:murein DD-endopeptidase MepM/ murein hydrolase activator NlpD
MKHIATLVILLCATSAALGQNCQLPEGANRPLYVRPADGAVVSGFGERTSSTGHKTKMHVGVDYRVALDSPVRAAASGEVLAARRAEGYGNYITLKHGNGYETTYAHLKTIGVLEGACVQAGDVIGKSGTTKLGGPHLHFEVRINSRFVDPSHYIADNQPR